MNTAANPYQAQAVTTAGPAQLVLMLYDRTLQAFDRCRRVHGTADPDAVEVMNTELLRAQDIITELLVTLDFDRGGEVAVSLAALYDYVIDRLLEANITKDLSLLDEIEPVVRGLRDAWEEACCGLAAVG